jgi:hypothetical protein
VSGFVKHRITRIPRPRHEGDVHAVPRARDTHGDERAHAGEMRKASRGVN